MLTTGVNVINRCERLSPVLLVVDLDGNTKCTEELAGEGFIVETMDLDGLYNTMYCPHDVVIVCSDYSKCPKSEMFGVIRQALSIMCYDRKLLLFGEWGVFRDDMLCGIPKIHKMTNCYSVGDDYGWYVWHCGRDVK